MKIIVTLRNGKKLTYMEDNVTESGLVINSNGEYPQVGVQGILLAITYSDGRMICLPIDTLTQVESIPDKAL